VSRTSGASGSSCTCCSATGASHAPLPPPQPLTPRQSTGARCDHLPAPPLSLPQTVFRPRLLWPCPPPTLIPPPLPPFRLPFEADSTALLYKKIRRGLPSLPPRLSAAANELLFAMIEVMPEKRISLDQVSTTPTPPSLPIVPLHLPLRHLRPDAGALQTPFSLPPRNFRSHPRAFPFSISRFVRPLPNPIVPALAFPGCGPASAATAITPPTPSFLLSTSAADASLHSLTLGLASSPP
jgi:hypothetical protein